MSLRDRVCQRPLAVSSNFGTGDAAHLQTSISQTCVRAEASQQDLHADLRAEQLRLFEKWQAPQTSVQVRSRSRSQRRFSRLAASSTHGSLDLDSGDSGAPVESVQAKPVEDADDGNGISDFDQLQLREETCRILESSGVRDDDDHIEHVIGETGDPDPGYVSGGPCSDDDGYVSGDLSSYDVGYVSWIPTSSDDDSDSDDSYISGDPCSDDDVDGYVSGNPVPNSDDFDLEFELEQLMEDRTIQDLLGDFNDLDELEPSQSREPYEPEPEPTPSRCEIVD